MSSKPLISTMAERNTVTTNKRKPKSSGGTPRRGDRSKLARGKTVKDLTEKEDPPVDLEPDGSRGTSPTYGNRYNVLDDSDDDQEPEDAMSIEGSTRDNEETDDEDDNHQEIDPPLDKSVAYLTTPSLPTRTLKSRRIPLQSNVTHETALTICDTDDEFQAPDPAFTMVVARSRRNTKSPPPLDNTTASALDNPPSPPSNRRSHRATHHSSLSSKKPNKNQKKDKVNPAQPINAAIFARNPPTNPESLIYHASSDEYCSESDDSEDEDFAPLILTELAQDSMLNGTVEEDEIAQLLADQQMDLDVVTYALKNPPVYDEDIPSVAPILPVFTPHVFSPDTPTGTVPKHSGLSRLDITPVDIGRTLLASSEWPSA